MNPITVLFFGSQGAGKGTQVQLLIESLKERSDRGIIRIDMGAELRALRDGGTLAGQLTGDVMSAGSLMPEFMPIYLSTRKLIENFTGEEHIIADGIARGTDQTKAFDDAMIFFKRSDLIIVNLVIDDETAVQRLLARGRSDDTEDAIRNRLAWHKTDSLPQIEFFRSRGRTIFDIDGESDEETVHQNILKKLNLV